MSGDAIPAPDAETPLENGARAATPRGDNIVLDHARAAAHAYAAVGRANGGRVASVPELGLHMVDSASPSPFGNLGHLVAPVPDSGGAALADELRTFFGGRSGGPYLLFSPWATPDLTPYGFTLAGHPPAMVRPPGGSARSRPELTIVAAADSAGMAAFEHTLAECYPTPELLPFGSHPRLMTDGLLESDWTFYIGYADGRPVCTAGAFVGEGVVLVEAVSTHESTRGRGFGEAITAAAAFTDPRLPSVLVSSDLGRRVYERLGYLAITRHTLWIGSR